MQTRSTRGSQSSRPTTSSSTQSQQTQSHARDEFTPATEDIGRGTMDFTPEQLARIGQMIHDAVGRAHTPDMERPDTRTPAWRDTEVGFFHPDCDDPQVGQVITVGHDTVHRDVHTFIDRLRDAVALRNEPLVRDRIPALLRGKAQQWYTTGLSDLEKAGLRASPIEHWYSKLRDLFKQPLQAALQNLIRCRYTLANARDRRPAHSYVYDVIRNARDAGMTTTIQQLTYAYAQTDVLLRTTLTEPTEGTGVSEYVHAMDRQAETWAQLATIWMRTISPNSSRPQSGNYPNRRAGTQQYQDSGRLRTNQYDQRGYSQQRTYDRPQSDRARTALALTAPRERLQLTDGKQSTSTTSDARQSSGRGPEPMRPFKARSGYVDVPEEEREAFWGDDEPPYDENAEDEPDDEREELVEVDTQYLQEPESPPPPECLYCHNQFSSGNRLHEHVRTTGHGKSKN